MVKMDKLKELVKVVLYSGYVQDEAPINLLIVGTPESGKSSLINRIVTNEGLIEVTDISAWGLAKMIYPLIDEGKTITHILIPDFLVVLAKSKTTAKRTLTFLNSIVEEGIVNIGTYLNKGIKFKTSQEMKEKRITCGVITAMTEKAYSKKKKQFNEIGFLSRFLVVRYKYSSGYLQNIFKSIKEGNYLHKESEQMIFPKEKIAIKYVDSETHNILCLIAKEKVASGNVDAYGIRLSKMLKTFLKAIALKNGRKKVIKQDWKEFLSYIPLINYSGRNIETIDEEALK